MQNVKPNSEIQIKIKYNDVEITLDIFHKYFEKKYLLSTTTLFKNDYELFTRYYNYYSREGVEFFYMYYNSVLSDNVKNLFAKSNVKLFEWNFDYWNNGIMGDHVAQTGQINHCFYKYGIVTDYMIFNDLDEYMCAENNTPLNTYIKLNPAYDYFMFLNHWSKLLDDEFEENKPNKVIKHKIYNKEFERCKCIVKTNIVDVILVHFPVNTKKIYHMYQRIYHLSIFIVGQIHGEV